MFYLKFFLITLLVFGALDFLWLGLISPSFYSKEFGSLARRQENGKIKFEWISAIVAYLLLALSITVFIMPKFTGEPITFKVFLFGALLGLVVYGVYDFTNRATLNNWSWKIVLVDVVWGMFIYGSTSTLVLFIAKKLNIF